MGEFPDNLNFPEQVAITITPIITSFASFLGSSIILYTFLRDFKNKLSHLKYRLLAAICLSDLVNSITYALWVFPLPPTNPGIPNGIDLWGAFGNRTTCNVNGMLQHWGNIGAHYNGALALYFLLSLKYKIRDKKIAKKFEIWMHLWGFVWPFCTGIVAWFMDLYNFGGLGCWIGPYPYHCQLHADIPCTRGERAYLYAWVLTGIPLALTNGVIAYCMIMTYRSVKHTYERAQRPIHRAGSDGFLTPTDVEITTRRYTEKIQQAGYQAVFYSAVFFATHCVAFVITSVEEFGGKLYFWILFLHLLLWPTQGFWNVFIFLRPTIIRIQKRQPGISYLKAAYWAAFREESPGRLSWTSANFMGIATAQDFERVDSSSVFMFFSKQSTSIGDLLNNFSGASTSLRGGGHLNRSSSRVTTPQQQQQQDDDDNNNKAGIGEGNDDPGSNSGDCSDSGHDALFGPPRRHREMRNTVQERNNSLECVNEDTTRFGDRISEEKIEILSPEVSENSEATIMTNSQKEYH